MAGVEVLVGHRGGADVAARGSARTEYGPGGSCWLVLRARGSVLEQDRGEQDKAAASLPVPRSGRRRQDFAPHGAVAVGWCQGGGSRPGMAQPGQTGRLQLGPRSGMSQGQGAAPALSSPCAAWGRGAQPPPCSAGAPGQRRAVWGWRRGHGCQGGHGEAWRHLGSVR